MMATGLPGYEIIEKANEELKNNKNSQNNFGLFVNIAS